jgi:class 3 adenylate cyclase
MGDEAKVESASQSLRKGERRNATVLFSDMTGFTSYSQGRDPEEIDRLMTSVFSTFEQIIRRRGGSVEKYIGDALVAVFGVPTLHEDDASRAIHAAWDFKKSAAGEWPELRFRTGIHSGLITTGTRGEFDVVTGHALAIAARLQTSADPGDILVSHDVSQVTRDEFQFSEPREIRVKGHDGPVLVRTVVGPRPDSDPDSEPFAGRETILQELTRRYMQVAGSSSASVVLTGEPGMGVSRVAMRFVAEIREFPRFDSPVFVTRSSSCSPSPYSAVWTGIRDALGIDRDSRTSDIEEALRKIDSLDENLRDTAVGFVQNGGVGKAPEQLFPAIRALLSELAGARSAAFPAIFVVDNVDELSLDERDLLRTIINKGGSPRFFVATGRDPETDAVDILPNASVIEVPPLSREETAALIMQLGQGTPDEDFVNEVYERTGGNPTFVRELFRFLEANPNLEGIPVGIQTVVLAGLQNLPEEQRELLKCCSVFDHPFRAADAAHLLESSPTSGSLDLLVAQHYLRREETRYAFSNELVRKSIYDSLLNHNKRVLHAAVAEAIEDDDLPASVRVRHLVSAARFRDAAETLMRQRGRVMNVDRRMLEPIDAIIASEVGDELEIKGELMYLKLAILFNTRAATAVADETIRNLLELGTRTNRSDLMGRAYAFVVGRDFRRGALHAARRAGSLALQHYVKSGASYRKDSIRSLLSATCSRLGQHDEARALIDEMENESMRLANLADLKIAAQEYVQALDLATRSMQTAQSLAPEVARFGSSVALSQVVRVLATCGAWQEIAAYRKQIESLIGPWHNAYAISLGGLAIAAHHLGEPNAESLLDQSAYFVRQNPVTVEWYEAPLMLASARIEMGHREEALADLEKLYLDLSEEPYEVPTVQTLALILRAIGDSNPERCAFFLLELESAVRDSPGESDECRMLAAWFRSRHGAHGVREEALREARSRAQSIVAKQGEHPFAQSLYRAWPYREILAE